MFGKPEMNIYYLETLTLEVAFRYIISFFDRINFQYMSQGRSQVLNRPLQDIAQNFDNDVIIMTLASLSWRQGKHEKF